MRSLYTLFLLLCFIISTNGQADYTVIRPATAYLFQQNSVEETDFTTSYLGVYSDELFEPWDQLPRVTRILTDEDGNECLQAIPQFLGTAIQTTPTETKLINTGYPDTFRILHQGDVGSEWLAYSIPEEGYELWMRILAMQTESVFGELDTVKVIRLRQSVDGGDFEILPIQLKIGKNFGLIQAADLWNLRENTETISLVGFNKSGEPSYTEQDFFNVNSGDRLDIKEAAYIATSPDEGYFQITEIVYDIIGMNCDPVIGATSIQFLQKSLSYKANTLSPDAIKYDSIIDCTATLSAWTFDWSTSLNWIQGKRGVFGNTDYESDPTIAGGGNITISEGPFNLVSKSLANELTFVDEQCLENSFDSPAPDAYYVGFVGPYYVRSAPGSYQARELVYGSTSAGIVGTPFSFFADCISNVSNVELGHNLSLFPNPAVTYTTIDLPDNFGQVDLSIYDLNGRQMLSLANVVDGQRITTTGLPIGVYQLAISQHGQLVGRKRLVVR